MSLDLAFSEVNQRPVTLLCAAAIGSADDHERIVELRKSVGGMWLTICWVRPEEEDRFTQKAVLVEGLSGERMAWLRKRGLVATAITASTAAELLRDLRAQAEPDFELEYVEQPPMSWIQTVIYEAVIRHRH